MTQYLNKLAWIGVALAILAWAFVPKPAWANAVIFPKVPVVIITDLPPVGTNSIDEGQLIEAPPSK